MTIVAIDTQILSYAIVSTQLNQKHGLVSQAKDFLKWVNSQKYDVIVPNIVVGELLIAIPEYDHARTVAQLSADYRIVPYDLPCARKFATLQQTHLIKTRRRDILKNTGNNTTRQALKADAMIIATAITHSATIMFSNDPDMATLAQGFIETKTMDDVTYQRSLFDK